MNNNKKIKIAALWSALEAITSAALSIISIVFLARILRPDDYGQIATAQVVAGLTQILLSLGLTEAVIQKKDLTRNHSLTVFWGTVYLSFLAIVILTICGIYFYQINKNETVALILIFEGAAVVLNLICILPTALLLKDLQMSAFTKRTLASRTVFFVVAIPLAMNKFGLWSIVFANFSQVLVATMLIFHAARKILPKGYYFGKDYFKELINFGVFVMLDSLLWSVMSRVFSLLIYGFHGSYSLGLYNMASRLTDAILTILNTVVGRLALPIFSSVQNDISRLKKAFIKATFIFNYISMPAFFGIAMTCNNWVPIILGEKWVPAIPIIQIIAIMNGIMFSRMFVGTTMKARGESRRFLYLSLTAAIVTIITAIATKNLTIIDTVRAWSLMRIIITIPVGIYLMKKIIGLGTLQQLSPIFIPALGSIVMAISVYLAEIYLPYFIVGKYWLISSIIIIGVTGYLVTTYIAIPRNRKDNDSLT